MKNFLFITTLTPKNLLSPLRKSLFDLYLEALKAQTYNYWNALLIGETEKTDGNIHYLKTNAISKTDKLKVAYEYIQNLKIKPDYIIRLDDDDLISPFALERAALIEFDCYSDLFHSFYALTSGKISQQKRDWMPNTVIHKYEHAASLSGEENLPLFMRSHNIAWHSYYSGKKVVFSKRSQPIYLRIISPTTITSKVNQDKATTIEGLDMSDFKRYSRLFGNWSFIDINDFKAYYDKLISIWENFSKLKIHKKRGFFNFFKRIR